MSTLETSTAAPAAAAPPTRKVGPLLAAGIFFLPIVFSWVTLKEGYSKNARVVALGWLLITLLYAFVSYRTTVDTLSTTSATTTSSASETTVAGPKWLYSEETDPMRGTKSSLAEVKSDNTLDFAPPYDGGSQGTFALRRQGGKLESYIAVEKGQILCSSFSDTYVSIKLDSGTVKRYECTGTSDGTSNLAFIHPTAKLLAGVRHAKKMILEAEFFQEGRRQMTFDVAGLKWSSR